MRYRKIVFLILLHCISARAAEVIVRQPKPVLVPTMQHLRDACAGTGKYDACTRFVAYRLEASCVPADGDTWTAQTQATFTPKVLLYDIHSLPHELEHVGDVHDFVLAYLQSVEAMRFSSEADCRQRALMEQKTFEGTLRDAANRSNRLRHPQVYGHVPATPHVKAAP